jgi:L-methionine (R)-S-oxide reductase
MENKEDKIQLYELTVVQVSDLLDSENDLIANLSNFIAVIHHNFGFFWTGFYLVKDNELVLSTFQGPVACTRISYDKGVCGTSWAKKQVLIVDDVHQFPGHIACSAASNSEIVLPLIDEVNNVLGVLDVDSTHYAHFDEIDQKYLQIMLQLLLLKHPVLI